MNGLVGGDDDQNGEANASQRSMDELNETVMENPVSQQMRRPTVDRMQPETLEADFDTNLQLDLDN